jgi:hypothetical protein
MTRGGIGGWEFAGLILALTVLGCGMSGGIIYLTTGF